MRDAAPYLEALVQKLARQSEQATRVTVRTLLQRFGSRRRDREAVAFIRGALLARGLAADLSATRPRRLDDHVVVRLVSAATARGGRLSLRSSPLRVTPVGRRTLSPSGIGPATSRMRTTDVAPALFTAREPQSDPGHQGADLSTIADRALPNPAATRSSANDGPVPASSVQTPADSWRSSGDAMPFGVTSSVTRARYPRSGTRADSARAGAEPSSDHPGWSIMSRPCVTPHAR